LVDLSSPDIDGLRELICVSADRLMLAKRDKAMIAPALRRKIGIAFAVAALCAAIAGCATDVTPPTTDASTRNQLRYYGGPKSPMWPGQ
jgi:hypothetical protein